MKGRLVWKGNLTFEGENEKGSKTTLSKEGISPMEMLLLSLGGCTGMDVISILQKMKEPVEEMEIEVEGKREEEHPRVFTEINLKFIVYGKVNPEKLKRAIELSQERYCSVSIMLKRGGVEVNWEYEIR
ncbi:OsmC family peroxiredoxin [bacterium]|nr:MAG: OsmC family peroxiredoxin [bacterium]RKZ24375.1 MAG: OsmC family peroxiredoxin [bacterium]